MHQTFEYHWTIVDVAVQRQVHPAQPTVRDAAPDFVLAGDDVTRTQLREKQIRASAERAPALGLCILRLVARAGSAHRPPTVPAKPFRLRHNRIGHQCFERVDVGHPRNLDQTATQSPDRRPRGRLHAFLRLGVGDVHRRGFGIVVVEIGAEDRLRGHRAFLRRRIHRRIDGLGARADVAVLQAVLQAVVGVSAFRIHRLLGHQSTYLGRGAAGAGPSTVNHLRYKVFQVPSRRIRSRVPLTNWTSPVLSSLIPMP